MLFADRLTLDAPRRTREGFMGVHARSARSGIYQYTGREIDPVGEHFAADEVVNVYRAPEEVFNARSLGSFVCKPITDNHPKSPVTAANWRDLARGTIMGAVQEGEYVGFDLAFLDAGIIEAIDAGKRELSNGYDSDILIGDGVAPDGTAYQARQVNIRGNHVAVVDKGRAGSTCRIGDAAICEAMPSDEVRALLADGQTYSAEDLRDKNALARRETSNPSPGLETRQDGDRPVATKTIHFDGMPIEATDASEAAIRKLEGQLADAGKAKVTAETQVATLTTDKSTLEAEKATLAKQVEDAKVTPAQLRDAAKVYQATADKAKVLGVKVTDEMDEGAIMKAAVTAKLGDAAKDWNDIQIAASFATMSKDTKATIDPVRKVISDGAVQIGDTASIRDAARSSRYAQ